MRTSPLVGLHLAPNHATAFFLQPLLRLSIRGGTLIWAHRPELQYQTLREPERMGRLPSLRFQVLQQHLGLGERLRGLLRDLGVPIARVSARPAERVLRNTINVRPLGQLLRRSFRASPDRLQGPLKSPGARLPLVGVWGGTLTARVSEQRLLNVAGLAQLLRGTLYGHRPLGNDSPDYLTTRLPTVLFHAARREQAGAWVVRPQGRFPIGLPQRPATSDGLRGDRRLASVRHRDSGGFPAVIPGGLLRPGHWPLMRTNITALGLGPKVPLSLVNGHLPAVTWLKRSAEEETQLGADWAASVPPRVIAPIRMEFRETTAGGSAGLRPVSLAYARLETTAVKEFSRLIEDVEKRLSQIRLPALSAVPSELDMRQLTRQVYDQFERELRIERERRGR